MSGECLHQFWSDSYRAPRNYDSDKGVAEQRCVKRNMHGLDTFWLCFDIFLDHKPAPPGVQHSYMSGKGQRFKSRPERPKKWWFHRFFHKNTRFFTFFSLQHRVYVQKKKYFAFYAKLTVQIVYWHHYVHESKIKSASHIYSTRTIKKKVIFCFLEGNRHLLTSVFARDISPKCVIENSSNFTKLLWGSHSATWLGHVHSAHRTFQIWL